MYIVDIFILTNNYINGKRKREKKTPLNLKLAQHSRFFFTSLGRQTIQRKKTGLSS